MKKFILLSVLLVLTVLSVRASDWYVATNGTGMGTNGWADATNNLQDAVSTCQANSTVWVSNGTYIVHPLTVPYGVIVNGKDNNPANVILDGNAENAVVFLGRKSQLIGVTIVNGNYTFDGAGVDNVGGIVKNCIVSNNTTTVGAGGIGNFTVENDTGIVQNCLVVGNIGVGIDNYGIVQNCTCLSNSVRGIDNNEAGNIVWNSISWGNGAADYCAATASRFYSCGVGYTNGAGCITNNPLFVSATDFHLQSNSPCINTGANGAWIDAGTKDLAGNQRIWPQGGTVDMGAYEYGSPPSYPAVITIHGSGLNLYGQGLSIRGTAQ
jgi:hypothetical protein